MAMAKERLTGSGFYDLATACQVSARQLLKLLNSWDSQGLTDLIYDMYERYHVERIENAFDDIDRLMSGN